MCSRSRSIDRARSRPAELRSPASAVSINTQFICTSPEATSNPRRQAVEELLDDPVSIHPYDPAMRASHAHIGDIAVPLRQNVLSEVAHAYACPNRRDRPSSIPAMATFR